MTSSPLVSRLLVTLVLVTLPTTIVAAPHDSVQTGPSPAAVEQATLALEANKPVEAIALLTPRPLAGRGTCVLGKALAAQQERPRALLYLQRCHRFEADATIRRNIAALRKALRKRALAPVSLSLSPSSATGKIDGTYAPDTLLSDDELWLAEGRYRLEVTAEGYEGGVFAVDVDSSDRMLVPISLRKDRAARATEIDLGEEPGAELGQVATATDPRPKEFDTLLAKRYRRAPDPTPVAAAAGSSGSGPWPWVTAVGGLGAIAGGIALQVDGKLGAALVGYGAGAALGGLTAYFLLRSDDEPRSPAEISATDESIVLSVRHSW